MTFQNVCSRLEGSPAANVQCVQVKRLISRWWVGGWLAGRVGRAVGVKAGREMALSTTAF